MVATKDNMILGGVSYSLVSVGAGGEAEISEQDIPKKMQAFNTFVENVKAVIMQGTEKYAGKEIDAKETIDIIPDILGEDGYKHFVYGDILKRIFRLKNQDRERDLIKIAVWMCLLWSRYHYGK